MHAVYVPDVVVVQGSHTLGHPDYEEQHHPEYKSYHELYTQHFQSAMNSITNYLNKEKLWCGSRFDLGSMTDSEYKQKSDENWDFCKNYLKNKGV